MGGRNGTGGMLLTSQGGTGATNNDAVLYLDQYNGTARNRLMSAGLHNVTMGDASYIVENRQGAALNIAPVSSNGGAAISYYGADPSNGSVYFSLGSYAGTFFLDAWDPHSVLNNKTIFSIDFGGDAEFTYNFGVGEDLTVGGNAFKPGGGTWSSTSDRRVKQDVAPLDNAIDTLLKLRPVSFRYTAEYRAMQGGLPDKPYLGFIAQEFADVFPEAVTSTGQHVPGAAKDAAPILALDSNPALITTVAAAQELAIENADLRRRVDRLSARLDALEARKDN